jgi:hypothetical protein
MFVVIFDTTINLDRMSSFCMDDKHKDNRGYFLKFFETSHNEDPSYCFAFQEFEYLENVYKEILFALQAGNKVVAITTFNQEK